MHDQQDGILVTTDRWGPGELIVRIAGELDIHTSPSILRALGQALGEEGAELMSLDLSEVTFCDHAGLRALNAIATAAGPARDRIVAAHRAVDTILLLCGLETFLGWKATAACNACPTEA